MWPSDVAATLLATSFTCRVRGPQGLDPNSSPGGLVMDIAERRSSPVPDYSGNGKYQLVRLTMQKKPCQSRTVDRAHSQDRNDTIPRTKHDFYE